MGAGGYIFKYHSDYTTFCGVLTHLHLLRDFTWVLIENNKSKDTKIKEKLLSDKHSKESKKMAMTALHKSRERP